MCAEYTGIGVALSNLVCLGLSKRQQLYLPTFQGQLVQTDDSAAKMVHCIAKNVFKSGEHVDVYDYVMD